MRTVDEGRPDQRSLRMKHIRENLLDRVSAGVIVAVTGRPAKVHVPNPVLLERSKHLVLIIRHDVIQRRKLPRNLLLRLRDHIQHLRVYVKRIL